MGKRVIIELNQVDVQRNSNQKFLVIVRIKEDDRDSESRTRVELPPIPLAFSTSLKKWREEFQSKLRPRPKTQATMQLRNLLSQLIHWLKNVIHRLLSQIKALFLPGNPSRNTRARKRKRHAGIGFTDPHSLSAKDLVDELNNWLKPLTSLLEIKNAFNGKDDVRVIIQTDDSQLRLLPWSEWLPIKESRSTSSANAEFALSNLNYNSLPSRRISGEKARILIVIGNSENININIDTEILSRLESEGVVLEFLPQPTKKELSDKLTNPNGWHIIFFTGHSSSDLDWSYGSFELDEDDEIEIADLRNSFRFAITRGLQLAIFNSCDGLGLANQLTTLQIPQCIVMREELPDEVAQIFLQEFLDKYLAQDSLYRAVSLARQKLEEIISDRYPGIHWLPVIVQHPDVVPPTWKELVGQGHQTKNFELPIDESFLRDIELIGREEELQNLKDLIIEGQPQEINRKNIVVIYGQPGIGKSILAYKFAADYRDNYPVNIYGLRVPYERGIYYEDALKNLAEKLVKSTGNISIIPSNQASELMNDSFEERRSLLIFDNADLGDDQEVNRFIHNLYSLFPDGKCATVVTTRNKNLADSWNVPEERQIKLDILSPEESFKCLTNLVSTNRERLQEITINESSARDILREVGYLPLAIYIIGNSLKSSHWKEYNLGQYLQQLRILQTRALDCRGESIWGSFSLSLKSLDSDVITFFASLGICAKGSFSISTAMAVSQCDESHTRHIFLKKLQEASLVSQISPDRFAMHALIHDFAHQVLVNEALRTELCIVHNISEEIAKRRHAESFIQIVNDNNLSYRETFDLLKENLEDVFLAAEWLSRVEDLDRTNYYNFFSNGKFQDFYISYRLYEKYSEYIVSYFQSAELNSNDYAWLSRLATNVVRYISYREAEPTNINAANEFSETINYLNKAREYIDKIDNVGNRIISEVWYWKALGNAYARQHQFLSIKKRLDPNRDLLNEAELALNRSIEFIEDYQDDRYTLEDIYPSNINISIEKTWYKVTIFRTYGKILRDRGLEYRKRDLSTARQYLERSWQAFQTSLDLYDPIMDHPTAYSLILGQLGEVLLKLGETYFDEYIEKTSNELFIRAKEALTNSVREHEVLGLLHGLSISRGNLSITYYYLEEYVLADELLRSSDAAHEEIAGVTGSRTSGSTRLRRKLNDIKREKEFRGFLSRGDFNGIVDFSRSENIDFSSRLIELGRKAIEQNDIDKAIKVFEASKQIDRRFEDSRGLLIALAELADAYKNRRNCDAALEQIQEAIDIDTALKNNQSLVMTYNKLFSIQEECRISLSERIETLNKIVNLNRALNEPDKLAATLCKLGKLYNRIGDREEALHRIMESIQIAQNEIPDEEQRKRQLSFCQCDLVAVCQGKTFQGKIADVNAKPKKRGEFDYYYGSIDCDDLPEITIAISEIHPEICLKLESGLSVEFQLDYYNKEKNVCKAKIIKFCSSKQ